MNQFMTVWALAQTTRVLRRQILMAVRTPPINQRQNEVADDDQNQKDRQDDGRKGMPHVITAADNKRQ